MFFNHCFRDFIVSSFFQRSSFTFSIPTRHFHQKFTLNVIYLKLLLFYFPSYILLLLLLYMAIESKKSLSEQSLKSQSNIRYFSSCQHSINFQSSQIILPKKGSDHSNLLLVNLLCSPYG